MIALPLDMESGPTQLKRLTPALSVKLRTSGDPEFPKVTQLSSIFPCFLYVLRVECPSKLVSIRNNRAWNRNSSIGHILVFFSEKFRVVLVCFETVMFVSVISI